jgi:hypothetical protein
LTGAEKLSGITSGDLSDLGAYSLPTRELPGAADTIMSAYR